MRKAILLVCFGTANKEAIENCIVPMEEEIRKEFNNKYLVLKAFTSKILMKTLKAKHGITVPRIDEALFFLASEGYEEVVIQPLHVMAGSEYEDIKNVMDTYSKSFRALKIGKTLLGFKEKELEIACDRFVDAISSEVPKDKNVVLVGHGSKNGSNESYYKLEERFKELGFDKLLIGTIDGDRNVDVIISELKEKEVRETIIIPILILPGNHAKKDIESGEKSWAQKLRNEGIEVEVNMKALLQYDKIRSVYVEEIRSLII
ncbi:MAG: sirohydrochlorin cobaltochelatase [Anaeroplasmataceae bacterium]